MDPLVIRTGELREKINDADDDNDNNRNDRGMGTEEETNGGLAYILIFIYKFWRRELGNGQIGEINKGNKLGLYT